MFRKLCQVMFCCRHFYRVRIEPHCKHRSIVFLTTQTDQSKGDILIDYVLKLFWMKIVYAFTFDEPKRAGTKLIRLANWIGCARVVRFETQKKWRQENVTSLSFLNMHFHFHSFECIAKQLKYVFRRIWPRAQWFFWRRKFIYFWRG